MDDFDGVFLRIRRVRNIQNPFDFIAQRMECHLRDYQSERITAEELDSALLAREEETARLREVIRSGDWH